MQSLKLLLVYILRKMNKIMILCISYVTYPLKKTLKVHGLFVKNHFMQPRTIWTLILVKKTTFSQY